eukprot:CAMPEP_0198723908 /NCGR_PEP_ID=MMETSP1475-20131203/1418_1 /TAXON_ID= ORGANISM="Unidentified sp., Strain CCMP1999" /NCGR_SAMPLE_ID=MMETSP1475 /ASSEMBLY_ACC=CAM_ASM_001111 /LENGTH=491 /DNA_ID=CAMNT_0044485237 /DNA_START=106 /DNA_END=1581 /DNA_ORIENTATION=-
MAKGAHDVLFQAFDWDSGKYHGSAGNWYNKVRSHVPELADMGLTMAWLPPPTSSLSKEGYLPKELDNLNSAYGSREDLEALLKDMNAAGIKPIADTVLNHRCASHKSPNGAWTQFGGKYNWDDRAIVCNDPSFPGKGHHSTGAPISIAPNIDHKQEFVQNDIIDWMKSLQAIGFKGWRIDYARGFSGEFVGKYIAATEPYFCVGEYWDSLDYDGGYLKENQDPHRSRICHWIDQTGKQASAFDFTTKGILMQAVKAQEYWRLRDRRGKPCGLMGFWPEKTVTFIDNHDTGSTQQHWPWPAEKVMEGYAYILTHPGVPTVFWDHVFDWKLKEPIKALIQARKNFGITKTSAVSIERAEASGYVARITASEGSSQQLYVKIGPLQWAPSEARGWKLQASGPSYAVWGRDGIPKDEEPTLPTRPSQIFGKMKIDPSKLKTYARRVPGDAGSVIIHCEYEMDQEEFEVTEFEITVKAVRGRSNDTLTRSITLDQL